MNNQEADFNIELNAQYLKDLSFESPNSPMSLTQREMPNIGVDVNVNVRKFDNNNFEVVLNINASAKNAAEEPVFLVSVSYAGIFDLSSVPEDFHKNILVIYCPTLLFPFARAIISDAVRDGGFPPLLLKPIDFSKLYNVDNKNQPLSN